MSDGGLRWVVSPAWPESPVVTPWHWTAYISGHPITGWAATEAEAITAAQAELNGPTHG